MSQTHSLEGLLPVLAGDPEGIVDEWSEIVTQSLRGRVSKPEVRTELAELYRTLRAGLESSDFTELHGLLAELSRARAVQGFSPRETAVSVFALKQVVSRRIGDDLPLGEFLQFSALVDDLGLLTFEAYSQAREQVIAEQAEQLLELSTPVVKLWDGIIAVPLVGTLDSARAQAVMEQLLEALTSTDADTAIIDITGVPAVDTQVAQHLLKTVMAARLMGAESIISGIRPQIAQTIVALGIEFGDIATKATLADALALALHRRQGRS
ncbi:STAS domain-containing protein [Cryptosporangium phraense]|uniref:STAS domain-containing protein n=1 Tax=Cryptosporangium phraense TaxID=2593070 RepID=A0A545AFK2_9ACTN|nr:STAS domain-containing protein [Cryptosporangium phraense]TQS40040.1 STAS domain-containing protein [Cryptosporangium phraense]